MIIFSPHSQLKLQQRNLNKDKVISTLENPDITSKSHGNRKIALKKFGKLYLKVVYIVENRDQIIITQHWVKENKL